MTIEVDSPSYAITTLSAVYRIHEMAEDPVLRRRAEDYITLFWALWAEHQLDGVGGGAYLYNYGSTAIQNSTITGNTADVEGGGIYSY